MKRKVHLPNMFSLTILGLPALLGLCACALDVDTMCRTALEIDCAVDYNPEGDETVCATDGNTYNNLCTFSKAKCLTSTIKIHNFGVCTSESPPGLETTPATTTETTTQTTPPPPPSLNEAEMVKRVFCERKDDIDCTDDTPELYCGSNGLFYMNECEFVKAQCDMPITRESNHYCDGHGHEHLHT